MKLYYSARRQFFHEKIYDGSYNKNIFTAQEEAIKAVNILRVIKIKMESISN